MTPSQPLAGGYVDLQVNGAAGHDLTEDPAAVWAVGAALARYGVTAFLPTLVSPGFEVVDLAMSVLAAGPPAGYAGATALGWHIEGPFLSPARAGAHDPATLRKPDVGAVRDWSPAVGVRIVTLAPELPAALDVAERLVGNGVVVSAGHSAATFDQARAGFDAGIRAVTHLFNAMSPLDHRDPGLPGAAMVDPRVTIGLIPDGIHVHPAMVRIVRAAVGAERLAIVTDAIAALGMPPGRHRLAGREVEVRTDETGERGALDAPRGASARLPDGTLAGSVLAMDQAVRNLAAFCEVEPARAALAATAVPRALLGLG
ncbi:MAG TPA: N-acetylglucosamine-6-phosphate deacetylase [Candidatus Limnocylindrales bacterium]|nr:N-acetylglucosamine-6-phosphate deacetylase [Candidatus Limnocylindrales bacterium]